MNYSNASLALTLLGILLLGGCRDNFPPGPDPKPDPIVKALPGTAWRLVSYEKGNGEVVVVDHPAESQITLRFTDSSISGEGPCNVYGGSCRLNANGAGTLQINSIFSTNLACNRITLENLYFTTLDNASQYSIDANALHILVDQRSKMGGGEAVVILNFAPITTPAPVNGGIQFRKVGAASDVFSLHRILPDGTGESVITDWMNFMYSAPQKGVSVFVARDVTSSGPFVPMGWQQGSGPWKLGTHPAIDPTSIALAPDGKTVAVIGYDKAAMGSQYHVYIYDLNGMAIDTCLNAEPFTTPAFSRDSRQIAYYGPQGRIRIATIGTNLAERDIADNSMPQSYPCSGRLEWTPDNSGVVYVGTHTNTLDYDHTDIWIANVNGGPAVNLTKDMNFDCWPIVHPDGKQIAYVHRTDAGTYSIYHFKLDGFTPTTQPQSYGPSRMPTVVLHDLFPQWSPDGRQLLYTAFTSVSPGGQAGFSGTLERIETSNHIPHRVADGAERGFWEM